MGQLCQSIQLECQDGGGPGNMGEGLRLRRNTNKSQVEILQSMGQMKIDGFDNCTYQIVETEAKDGDTANNQSAKIKFMQDNHMVEELNVTVDIKEVDNQIKVVLTEVDDDEKDKSSKKLNFKGEDQTDHFAELKMTDASVLESNRPSMMQNSEGRAVEGLTDKMVGKQITALKTATKEDSVLDDENKEKQTTSVLKQADASEEKPSDAVKAKNPLAALTAAGGKQIDLKKLIQENLEKEIQNKMTRMTIVKQETQKMDKVGGDDSDPAIDDDDDFDDDDDSSDYQEEQKTQPATGDKAQEQSTSDKEGSPKQTASEAMKLTTAK